MASTFRAGDLLVAAPELLDPNFHESVVLLLDLTDGALGVVLNRPSTVPVDQVLAGWRPIVNEPPVLYRGGPVAPEGALAVGQMPAIEGVDQPGWQPLFEDYGLLDLDAPTELFASRLKALRIFVGYAGWGGGQLEDEIAEGSWYVVPSRPHDVFGVDHENLRRDVLRRQPGELAWVSTRPADPRLN